MKLYIKIATAKSGRKYHAMCVEKNGLQRTLCFDIESILLLSGWSYAELMTMAEGKYEI